MRILKENLMSDTMKIKLTTAMATATKSLQPGNIITRSKKDGRAIIDAGCGVEYTGDDSSIDETAAVADTTEKAVNTAATEKAVK